MCPCTADTIRTVASAFGDCITAVSCGIVLEKVSDHVVEHYIRHATIVLGSIAEPQTLVVEFYVGSVDSAFAPSVCKALNGATSFPQLTVVN